MDKTCILYILNALNFLSILALIAAAIARFTYFGDSEAPTDPFFYILTFYLFPVAALLMVAELGFQSVLKYFAFLGTFHGKGFFIMFVALLLFDTNFPVDATVSIILTLVGIFNMVATCVIPGSLATNKLLTRATKGFKSEEESKADTENDSSENDADDQDHLLPQTYGSGAANRRR